MVRLRENYRDDGDAHTSVDRRRLASGAWHLTYAALRKWAPLGPARSVFSTSGITSRRSHLRLAAAMSMSAFNRGVNQPVEIEVDRRKAAGQPSELIDQGPAASTPLDDLLSR